MQWHHKEIKKKTQRLVTYELWHHKEQRLVTYDLYNLLTYQSFDQEDRMYVDS